MILLFAVYLLLCLYKVRVMPLNSNQYFIDYISKEKTASIKGIFIILVFFSHFNSYNQNIISTDPLYIRLFVFIGQAMVAMFLFYSGYGVMESIRKKGRIYIQSIPRKRILVTGCRFACIVLVYALLSLAVGNKITILQLMLSLVGWESVGNSNWYIFSILWLYFFSYIAFSVCGDKNNYSVGAWLFLAMTGGYILVMLYLKQSWWYDTVLCYCVGVFYSLWRGKIEKVINKSQLQWVLCLLISILLTVFFTLHPINIWVEMLRNIMFVIAFVILTMRVQFSNSILWWCGENLFAMYMLQRIPMILSKKTGLIDWNMYISFGLCIAATILLVVTYSKIIRLFNSVR